MRTSTTIGERFPATSAHLLAMQRMTTQTQAGEDEEARTLALPGALPAIHRRTSRRWCVVRLRTVTEDIYELR